MESGLFLFITGKLTEIPRFLIIMFLIGIPGSIFLIYKLPGKIFEIIELDKEDILKPVWFYLSILFLFLAGYGVLESIYSFIMSEPGEVSGLMLPILLFLPFVFYMLFEILSRGTYEIYNDD